jgi:hypothetical protein
MQTKEMAILTIRTLMTKGWAQGKYKNDKGHLCIWGAVGRSGADRAEMFWYILDFLAAEAGFDGITAWNDHPGRTYEEVIGLLDKLVSNPRPSSW